MAAAIENEFGITAELIEGHNGIYEVVLNGNTVYTNRGESGPLPEDEDILQKLRKLTDPRPEGDISKNTSEEEPTGSSCCGPSPSADKAVLAGSTDCCPPTGDAAAETVVPCCPGSDTPPTTCMPPERKLIAVEFLYLDLSVCGRCQGSDSGLDAAVAEARPVLESLGIELAFDKVHVQTEEQARALRFASSPTIRINSVDIAPEIRESLCEDCADICGDSVDCREWEYDGETYAVPPKALILDAIFKAVYAETPVDEQPYEDVPDNLKRFFDGKKN